MVATASVSVALIESRSLAASSALRSRFVREAQRLANAYPSPACSRASRSRLRLLSAMRLALAGVLGAAQTRHDPLRSL
jgi:hypothetical protein